MNLSYSMDYDKSRLFGEIFRLHIFQIHFPFHPDVPNQTSNELGKAMPFHLLEYLFGLIFVYAHDTDPELVLIRNNNFLEIVT